MMRNVRAAIVIGGGTFIEAMRSRLLWVAVAFAAVLVFMSVAGASVAVFERQRLIIDVGLGAASGLGGIVALAASVALLSGELQGRTAYVMLARPIARWAYVFGKFLGLWLAMVTVVVAMGLSTAAVFSTIFAGDIPDAFWPALYLTSIEMAVVVALALMFGTIAVPALAATYAAGVWIAGNMSDDILALAQRSKTDPSMRQVLAVVHALLPDLSRLSLRNQAANSLAVPDGYLVQGTSYGLTYAALLVCLAALVLTRRKAL